MKLFGARGCMLALAGALLATPTLVEALPNLCNLPPSSCPAACGQGCPFGIVIAHRSQSPCTGPNNGSFNLRGTQFQDTCLNFGSGGGCATVSIPPVRWWQYDNYGISGVGGGNSGCPNYLDLNLPPIINAFPDLGSGTENGHWILYQSNWQGPTLDGCISPLPNRTVGEITWPDSGPEGTLPTHFGWYLISAVPTTSGFDFDGVTGGTGCNGHDITPANIGGVTVGTKTFGPPSTCQANTTPVGGTNHGTDTNAWTVPVTLETPTPTWYTENGLNGAPALIAGYQIVYQAGAEPTNSSATGWLPALDNANTANKAFFAVGTTGSQTVALPFPPDRTTQCAAQTAPLNHWLATRLVYQDAALNAAPYPLTGLGPRVLSVVSRHCGPAQCPGGVIISVDFDEVTAERTREGIRVRWTTLSEDDTMGFVVHRSLDAAGTEAVTEAGSIEAHGALTPYEIIDRNVDSTRTYYYKVDEVTEHGIGSQSRTVRVDPVGRARSAGQGRARIAH